MKKLDPVSITVIQRKRKWSLGVLPTEISRDRCTEKVRNSHFFMEEVLSYMTSVISQRREFKMLGVVIQAGFLKEVMLEAGYHHEG